MKSGPRAVLLSGDLRHIRLRVGDFQAVDPGRGGVLGVFGGETFYFGILLDVRNSGKDRADVPVY